MMRRVLTFLACLALCGPLNAAEVTVAVAANFLSTAEVLVERFEAQGEDTVVLVHGSTGTLTAQAIQGAPYDILLAADDRRPAILAERGLVEAQKTYALGRLVLIARGAINPDTFAEVLAGKTVALADPTVAPYGLAAIRAMESLHLDTATFRPVLVSDVGQVASVFATGNADFAFVAASQIPLLSPPAVIDLEGRYPEIRQDAVLLTRAEGNAAALAFWDWLDSDEAGAVIKAAGYGAP